MENKYVPPNKIVSIVYVQRVKLNKLVWNLGTLFFPASRQLKITMRGKHNLDVPRNIGEWFLGSNILDLLGTFKHNIYLSAL